MDEKPSFPFLVLVASGGHTLLLLVESFTKIKKLGSTADDAAGEAFDKVSKLLGFGYPGGPQIQKAAEEGEGNLISFPVADLKEPYNFSFSGLKTAVLRYIQSNYKSVDSISKQEKSNIAAAFQNAVVKALTNKVEKALNENKVNSLSLVGGVAANAKLRKAFENLSVKYHKNLVIPSLEFCGDNAAMIGFRGMKLYEFGIRDDLDTSPYPGLTPMHFSQIEL
jgi:N6-L-threonylcarbamoyladenine synthase